MHLHITEFTHKRTSTGTYLYEDALTVQASWRKDYIYHEHNKGWFGAMPLMRSFCTKQCYIDEQRDTP